MFPHLLCHHQEARDRLREVAGDGAVEAACKAAESSTVSLVDSLKRATNIAEHFIAAVKTFRSDAPTVDEVGKHVVRCFELEAEHRVPATIVASEIVSALLRHSEEAAMLRSVIDDVVSDVSPELERAPRRSKTRRSRQARGRRARSQRRAAARASR